MEILQQVDAERMRTLRDRGEFFWLDLTDPSAADLDTLSKIIPIHHLALEDTHESGQRAKFDEYPHSALLVFYGAEPRASGRPRLVEVHLHIFGKALVTVTREPLAALGNARRRVTRSSPAHVGQAVHGVLDALTDSLLDALEGFDAAIDDLQGAVAEHATTADRQRIFELRRQLAEMRQIVMPQRDLLAPNGDLIDTISHLPDGSARDSFRDVHDHLDRAAKFVDSYREQLASLLDLYLAEISTRLNEFMKRLSVIATIFLPLSFLVGFFGMNFGWLLQELTPTWTFFVFGIALLAASGVVVAFYLRRSSASPRRPPRK